MLKEWAALVGLIVLAVLLFLLLLWSDIAQLRSKRKIRQRMAGLMPRLRQVMNGSAQLHDVLTFDDWRFLFPNSCPTCGSRRRTVKNWIEDVPVDAGGIEEEWHKFHCPICGPSRDARGHVRNFDAIKSPHLTPSQAQALPEWTMRG
jgi:hypothetical protein